eukprot:CAMPEP_0115234110 /NCGR_PEP_ID=MMETSP0270-20121206/34622_1 /TAXON_ID=71861 /ORGANISM="Scrippsiella trochoidea, Strain CCMP3099" /LENGTH=167 /DNA_ID=CAMNT_0002648843 /DNA_START=113 /DNA_END=616 /DNA_ORIENTATION=-
MPFELSVKSRQQQILIFDVEEVDTIGALKRKIRDKVGSGGMQPLFFKGVELADDDASLLEYDIVPDDCPGGPVIALGSGPSDSFCVAIELPGGRVHEEMVTGETTVAQLKGRITSQVGIPYLAIKLFVGDAQLKDRFKLVESGISPGATKVRLATSMPLYAGPAARF